MMQGKKKGKETQMKTVKRGPTSLQKSLPLSLLIRTAAAASASAGDGQVQSQPAATQQPYYSHCGGCYSVHARVALVGIAENPVSSAP